MRILSWISCLLGIWAAVAPFLFPWDVCLWVFLAGIIPGILVALLSAWFALGPSKGLAWLCWICAVLGVWIAVSPFVAGYTIVSDVVWANFVPTKLQINPKAKKWTGKNELYRIVEAINGKEFEGDQLTGADIKSLIGKQCIIFTRNTEPNANGKVFTNIWNYKPIVGSLEPLTEEEKERSKIKKEKIDNEEAPFDESSEDNTPEVTVDDIPL